jgi:hypothetical protein
LLIAIDGSMVRRLRSIVIDGSTSICMLAVIDITAVAGRTSAVVTSIMDRSVIFRTSTVVGPERSTSNGEISSALEVVGHVGGEG